MQNLRLTGVLLALLLLGVGCNDPPTVDTVNWSKPEAISKTLDGIGSSFSLYKWNNSLVAMNSDAGPFSVFFLQPDGRTWVEKTGPPAEWLPLDVSPSEDRFVASKGLLHKNDLTVGFFVGGIASDGRLAVKEEAVWKTDKASFFDKNGDNISFEAWNSGPVPLAFDGGSIRDEELYVPYCITGATLINGAVVTAEGPFDNGVFFSLDSGKTWKSERIDSTDSVGPQVRRTDKFHYFTAARTYTHELWFSRKAADGGSWSMPTVVTDHYAAWNLAVAHRDTVHACWLDRRHEKRRANLFNPWRKNYEVAYCHRKDSDAEWSEDVILSKGLLYAYEPAIAIEGTKLVVAWSGVQHDKDGHQRTSPNDIFYVASKDGGDTWTKPMKVTDGFKDGITSGKVRVEILNGVIHLFYAQGKMSFKEVSAGLALVNQPPWPIYYTQRTFPE